MFMLYHNSYNKKNYIKCEELANINYIFCKLNVLLTFYVHVLVTSAIKILDYRVDELMLLMRGV